MSNLKTALQKLVAQAKTRGLSQLSEEHVQGGYTLKVLEALGWNDGGWIINSSQEHTGKRPDIILKDAKGWTMLVIESKDCKGQNKLDGYDTVKGRKRTYQEQIINYCKAEGVYWGVLTNFIEWRLYNAHRGILYPQNKKYAFHDLLWDGADKKEYTDLLSKDGLAFLAQFARKPLCKKLGKLDEAPVYYPEEKQVRDDFFSRIKVWREALRDELWQHNQHLITDKEKVELYTQKILDRMIFMDVCHDKRIVGPDGHRAILYAQDSVYAQLRKWFGLMDELFNTDLFAQDDIIDKLVIRNEVLSPIVEELSGIDFSLLPVRIIGDVYEDYLGEMLRGGKIQGLQVQDDKARGKRKSQGIYYTPEYIVDYITTNTVGALLDLSPSTSSGQALNPSPGRGGKQNPTRGKGFLTEADIKKIKALDPACGSGSFLINAFDKFYQAYKKAGVVAKIGDFAVKKAILQHNLYGVDLDERAVEICKLNLMLKALDGAKWEELKGRKLLPSLELNIRCGNSLISGKSFADKAKENPQTSFVGPYDADRDVEDLLKLRKKFYKAKEDGEKKALLAQIKRDEEVINSKLNDNLRKSFTKPSEQKPLNFEVVFPEVFAQRGFDAVIGNPPYVRQEGLGEFKKYFETHFKSYNGMADIYTYFIERGISLLNSKGRFSFIVNNKWMRANYGKELRSWLLAKNIIELIDFGDLPIFKDATTYPCILLVKGGASSNMFNVAQLREIPTGNIRVYIDKQIYEIEKTALQDAGWSLADQKTSKLLAKIEQNSISLDKYIGGNVFRGIVTGYNKAFVINEETKDRLIKEDKASEKVIKPFLLGRDVKRYEQVNEKQYLIFTRRGIDIKQYTAIEKHLLPYKEYLMPKPDDFARKVWKGRKPGNYQWYEIQDSIEYWTEFEKLKIIYPNICKRPEFTLDGKGFYSNQKCFIIPKDDKYLLGILNSKLSHFILNHILPKLRGGFYEPSYVMFKEFPVRQIDHKNKTDKIIHAKIIKYVKVMLALNKTPASRENNTIRIAAVDKQIDELVYRLYGLSEAEKKVVGGQ